MDTIIISLHELQEAITGMAVMAGIRLERELTMHKDNSVSLFQEELCWCRSTSSCTEVVDEPDRVCLQWHCRTSTLLWFRYPYQLDVNCMKEEGGVISQMILMWMNEHPRPCLVFGLCFFFVLFLLVGCIWSFVLFFLLFFFVEQWIAQKRIQVRSDKEGPKGRERTEGRRESGKGRFDNNKEINDALGAMTNKSH